MNEGRRKWMMTAMKETLWSCELCRTRDPIVPHDPNVICHINFIFVNGSKCLFYNSLSITILCLL